MSFFLFLPLIMEYEPDLLCDHFTSFMVPLLRPVPDYHIKMSYLIRTKSLR